MNHWERLVAHVRSSDAAVGLILSGSRGRGLGGADSDWDGYLIVVDEAAREAFAFPDDPRLELSVLTMTEFREYAAPGTPEAWDAYVNSAVRSAQGRRDGQEEASVLDAAGGAASALETLFALERRIRPYNRYLAWELQRHPLRELRDEVSMDLPAMMTRGISGSTADAHAVFELIESAARRAGHGDVVDAWDRPALALVRGGP